jgi:hypothetical protein
LQGCGVWISEHSIEKGTLWRTELAKSIRDHWFGVLFLTQENKRSEWILFEAGGLYKGQSSARIVPLLIDLTEKELAPPLSMFQCATVARGDMLKLVQAINRKRGKRRIRDTEVQKLFAKNWDQFANGIRKISKSTKTARGAAASQSAPGPIRIDSAAADLRRVLTQFVDTRTKVRGLLPERTYSYLNSFDPTIQYQDQVDKKDALQALRDLNRVAGQFPLFAPKFSSDAKLQYELLSYAHALIGPSDTPQDITAYQNALGKADKHYSALERQFSLLVAD